MLNIERAYIHPQLCKKFLTYVEHKRLMKYTPSQLWFMDAKFGIFIHWGIYSLLKRGEWVMHNEKIPISKYEPLKDMFEASLFEPQEWVELFKDAGARYVTFTSKHHDGFCMYDSALTEYKVTNTPLGRDVVGELRDACNDEGLKLFLYYSQLDWHHPDYYPLGRTGQYAGRVEGGDWERYLEYYIGQVRELAVNYKPVGFWFDGMWDKPDADWKLHDLYQMIHSILPNALIGNNHHRKPYPGEDFQIFEQSLPGEEGGVIKNTTYISDLPLETCLTINNSWGYNEQDHQHKSVEKLLEYLVKTAGMNSNLLLNVGPRPDGTIQKEHATRLIRIGEWLRKYGEAIYRTRGVSVEENYSVTRRDEVQYLMITTKESNVLKVPFKYARLHSLTPLKFELSNSVLYISEWSKEPIEILKLE